MVNRDHPVTGNGAERRFMDVSRYEGRPVVLEQRTASVLSYIFKNIGSGEKIIPVSGYRTRKEQEQIYAGSIRDNGEIFTRKYVALPDHSEHQTGLAIDLGLNQENIDFI
ncbi:MAG: D-alanyl-D-alanine carboxypeptidase family protein, partial [Bacillota bacterium]|nr:D-alanyl-D-alanine carboxypeptidase family protein [Bacillota bacterium]